MAVNFITTLNGIITGQHCGDINADFFNTPYYGHERIVIPKGAMISIFDRLEFYDELWNRKSNTQLIDEGLLPMPEGYIRDGDDLRHMTPEERIISGLDEPEPGTKVIGKQIVQMTQVERIAAGLEELQPGYRIDGDELLSMTMAEQLAAGQITQTDYDQHLASENAAELDRRLAELQTPVAVTKAERDPKFAAERKAKQDALLALMEQPRWPIEVEWPE